jgi:hypothetical protein
MADRQTFIVACILGAFAPMVAGCAGIEAGIDYPGNLPDVGPQILSPEGESGAPVALNRFKFKPDLCKGVDTHLITGSLSQEDFARYLEAQGAKIDAKKARGNLYWFDFPNGEEKGFVRLRLALLDNPAAAAKDLHDSLLEHGPGWWGVRRANLAVLAPKASLSAATAFAIKYKLVCWGMFTYAGLDDAYVVPGPYMEL